MATIAELVLKLRGDNTDLRQTLADSAQRAIAFTRTIEDAMAKGRNSAQSSGLGALAAKSFLESMQATLASELQRIKEMQYNMFITPAEAERQGGQAALAYNESILQTIANLRASGNLTATLERQLIENLDKAGLKAGIALQQAVARGLTEGQSIANGAASKAAHGTFTAFSGEAERSMRRTTMAVTQANGAFTMFGHRGATALTAIGFGMEAFANGTEGGVRRSLRSVESFALFFGPTGLMVAALTTGLFALYDYFHKAEKRAEQAARTINGTLSAAINSADQLGVMKAYRDLLQGQASTVDQAGEITISKPSQFAIGAFEGSLADLRAEQVHHLEYVKTHTDLLRAAYEVRLRKLGELIKPMEEREKMLTGILNTPPTQMRFVEPRKPIEIGGKSAATQAAAATKEYYEQLSILVSRLQAAQAAGLNYSGVLQQILEAYAKLGGSAGAVSGAGRAGETVEDTQRRLAMIKELQKTLMDIGPRVTISVEGLDMDKLMQAQALKVLETPAPAGAMGEQLKAFDNLISQIQIYRNNIELTNLDLQAQGKAVIDIEKAIGPLRDQAVAMAVDLRKALRAAGLDPAIVDLLVQHWLDGLKLIGAAGETSASKLQKMADVLGGVSELFSALGDAASAEVIGNISRAASDIGAAVAAGGKDPVADLRAAASVVSAVKSMFDSPLHREQLAAMRENNRRLQEVSLRLQGFATNPANATAAAGAAGQALREQPGLINALELFGTLQDQINVLTPYLNRVGLTWLQFAQIAKDQGFQIFDSHGRIIESALAQFVAGMNDAVKALFTFQNTLSDQKALSDLQAKLSGVEDTPQQQLDRNLALLQHLAPNLLPGASGQGALNQDALRKMLQDLLQRIAAGEVNPADFGGFQNLQELIGVIDSTADSLNQLRDVTNGVTAALTNVPTGFKLALTEFDAQDAIARNLGKLTPPEFVPPLASGGITFNIQAGAIAIDPTNKNAAEIGRETLEGLKSLAGQKLGNRSRWAELV